MTRPLTERTDFYPALSVEDGWIFPELLVVGAGPAGLAAAIEAKRCGVGSVLVVDREREPGGILNQCVHSGFGLFHFGEVLTGPEYAERLVNDAARAGVTLLMETFVARLDSSLNAEVFSKTHGLLQIRPGAIVLAMGCRERTRAAVAIPGTRPAGVFSAGTAQRLINIEGYALGKKAVIVGSGDIGLIMARRLTLEGVEVAAVIEIRRTPSGLPRNVSQCLNAFSIPLKLGHRVAAIEGESRVTGVIVEPVAGGHSIRIECDLILFSVGLIPENELSAMAGATLLGSTNGLQLSGEMQTTVPGIFACGNAYRVYDLVDEASREAAVAGRAAAAFLGYSPVPCERIRSDRAEVQVGSELRLTTESGSETRKNAGDALKASLMEYEHSEGDPAEIVQTLVCVICPKGCQLTLGSDGAISGFQCERGYEFALQELRSPGAVLTSTVAILGGLWPRLPCKTTQPLPRRLLKQASVELSKIIVKAPVRMGDILCRNLGGLGVDVIATRSMR